MSATTHTQQNHSNVAGVPPAPSEAHQKADHSWEKVFKALGLAEGQTHCVTIKSARLERTRRALVEITERGHVYLLAEPQAGDMYSSWSRVDENALKTPPKDRRSLIVWGARDPEVMKRFDNPVAVASKE